MSKTTQTARAVQPPLGTDSAQCLLTRYLPCSPTPLHTPSPRHFTTLRSIIGRPPTYSIDSLCCCCWCWASDLVCERRGLRKEGKMAQEETQPHDHHHRPPPTTANHLPQRHPDFPLPQRCTAIGPAEGFPTPPPGDHCAASCTYWPGRPGPRSSPLHMQRQKGDVAAPDAQRAKMADEHEVATSGHDCHVGTSHLHVNAPASWLRPRLPSWLSAALAASCPDPKVSGVS